MITNEETTYQGMEQEKEQKAKAEVKQGNATASWEKVSISGVTGILIGAGTMYAANAMAGEKISEDTNNAQPEVNVSTSTNSDVPEANANEKMSFGEAFAAAREQQGAGGVFEWNGKLYSTYYENEWNAMSEAEQRDFAERATHQRPQIEEEEEVGESVQTSSTEPEVHFLGVESFDSDGQRVAVGRMTVDEQNVWLVDVDEDEVFDIAMSDRDHSGQIDDEEVLDISDSNITVEQFADAVIEDGNASGNEQYYASNEDGIDDSEMPDYMDDADIHTI